MTIADKGTKKHIIVQLIRFHNHGNRTESWHFLCIAR